MLYVFIGILVVLVFVVFYPIIVISGRLSRIEEKQEFERMSEKRCEFETGSEK